MVHIESVPDEAGTFALSLIARHDWDLAHQPHTIHFLSCMYIHHRKRNEDIVGFLGGSLGQLGAVGTKNNRTNEDIITSNVTKVLL
jgi:hypothetical protein